MVLLSMRAPKENEKRINDVIAAWERYAPRATFAKMTLAEFKLKLKSSLDRRNDIRIKEAELSALQRQRDDADRVSLPLCGAVVKAVVGDTDYGEDCELYAAMGYVRKSERRTGLTRRSTTDKLANV